MNIHGFIEITLPEDYEVLSVKENLESHTRSEQYGLIVEVECLCGDYYLPFTVELFGEGQERYKRLYSQIYGASVDDERDSRRFNRRYYTEDYNGEKRLILLRENLKNHPEITNGGNPFSRIFFRWDQDWARDYYAVYIPLDNPFFSEGVIGFSNLWSTFGGHKENRHLPPKGDFRQYLKGLEPPAKGFFEDLEKMILSAKIDTGAFDFTPLNRRTYPEDSAIVIPTIKNLRLRRTPGTDAPVLGYVKAIPYRIIGRGGELTVNSISGRWIRIRPLWGGLAGWAFDGYIRPLEKEEVIFFSEVN